MKSIYLAGPIANVSNAMASGWYSDVVSKIDKRINCYCPLRTDRLINDLVEQTDNFIMGRDYNDVKMSDAIICNLLGTTKVSIGSCMEIAWAFSMQKPVILVIEDENNIHEHPMIRKACDFRTPNLLTAVRLVETILLPSHNYKIFKGNGPVKRPTKHKPL